MASLVRLYVDHPLAEGQSVRATDAQAHYLLSVMRHSDGDEVLVFNGRDGEWRARLVLEGRRSVLLAPLACVRAQVAPPDLWLLFAPLKKARTDFLVEKAVELGTARLSPVATDFTNAERIRPDRLRATAVEAAEQCGALHVAEVDDLLPLRHVLAGWDDRRPLWFCDEDREAPPPTALAAFRDEQAAGGAILVGPEGGFSPAERTALRRLPFVLPVSLGPRILRAETAAVAALSVWQAAAGDWR